MSHRGRVPPLHEENRNNSGMHAVRNFRSYQGCCYIVLIACLALLPPTSRGEQAAWCELYMVLMALVQAPAW